MVTRRAGTAELLTIGYQGCTIQEVLTTLLNAQVKLLIDVRAMPRSRKPGFSKRQLAAGLDAQGIPYVHLQGLGTPKPGRDAVRAGHPEIMETIFHEHMTSDRAQADLARTAALAWERRACLLCFERDPACCHRRIVAEMIAAETGQGVVHLMCDAARVGPARSSRILRCGGGLDRRAGSSDPLAPVRP